MPIDSAERARRRALLQAHYAAENEHDVDRIMRTFSTDGIMIYNHQSFGDEDVIRQAHAYIGFAAGGAFENIVTRVDTEHFTDDEIVVEGRLSGRHVGEFQGFAPTGRDFVLPFVGFYRFDAAGKLVSERIVMNLGTLGEDPSWTPR